MLLKSFFNFRQTR